MPNHPLIRRFLQAPVAQKIALLCAACSLFAALVLIVASYQSNLQLIKDSSTLFGESLSKQLANDASNPLVQGDKLILQALLKKLVESPLVTHASIYDIQNRPIATAGDPKARGQSLSASVTFQDSIAGYALITLDTDGLDQQASSLAWQLVLLALLLTALSFLLSLYSARYFSSALKDIQAIASSPRRRQLHFAYPGDDEIKQLAEAIIHSDIPPTNHQAHSPPTKPPTLLATQDEALLLIKLQDFDALKKHHDSKIVATMLSTLQQQLEMIAALYDGKISIERRNCFCIYFQAKDGDNYPFRALCSGYLILQWREQNYSPLQIGAAVTLFTQQQNDDSLNNIDRLFLRQTRVNTLEQNIANSHQLIIEGQLEKHPSVIDKTIINSNKDRIILKNVTDTYRNLLDKQLLSLDKKTKEKGAE